MKFVVKLHPEIIVKSRSARQRLTQLLEQNIRSVCKQGDLSVQVNAKWDSVDVVLGARSYASEDAFIDLITRIPGVYQCVKLKCLPLGDLEHVCCLIADSVSNLPEGESFCVKVKTTNNAPLKALDVAKLAGYKLLQRFPQAHVSLKQPDNKIEVQIKPNELCLVEGQHIGLGGMPLPSQGNVLCLVSGGYDSIVTAYQLIRRGAKVHFCYFNLGQDDPEQRVRKLCYALWKKYSASHKVKFIEVDFSNMIHHILTQVDDAYMGVVLKRCMMRAAALFADTMQINTLATGECLGQVASQTLANLQLIDSVTEKLILRPLISLDKEQIIEQARKIGMADACASIPEYCSVISNKPTLEANLQQLLCEEETIHSSLFDSLVKHNDVEDIRKVVSAPSQIVTDADRQVDMLIDIRHPSEIEQAGPISWFSSVISIPFYKLMQEYANLDQDLRYGLYCEQGMMSRFQCKLLNEQGFMNCVVVNKPANA